MTTTLPDVDENLLQEQVRIEKLKGQKGGGNYASLPPTEGEIAWREAQAKRQQAAKQPTPARPPTEIDPLEQRRAQLQMEQHKEFLKGPIRRQGAS